MMNQNDAEISETYSHLLIQHSRDLIQVLDRDGNILYASPSHKNVGYEAREISGRSLFSLIDPDDTAIVRAAMQNLSQEGSQKVEFRLRDPKDGRLWVEANLSLITEADLPNTERMLLLAFDITKQKQVEEILKQYMHDLEVQNADLEAFAHTVAHDLRGPLTQIIGLADALDVYYSTMTSKEIKQYLSAIVRNGHKVNNIIDELLLLATVRKEEVVLSPLDMEGIVAEALQRLGDMIDNYGATVLMPERWPVALGRGPWIEEVWVNYISNGIKYGGRPPQIELGGAVQADGKIRFWVQDNGAGLTSEEQAKLFTPFTRLGRVRAKGYGLGLSIVQRIVEKLGGEVGVESSGAAKQGSTFFFTLPAAEAGAIPLKP